MDKEEKHFENFIRGINFDDRPDYEHRDRLERELLTAMAKGSRQQGKTPIEIWRIIMRSKITRVVAAAAVVILISIAGWFTVSPGKPAAMSSFTLLAEACAAEQALFTGNKIMHLVSEITVYPTSNKGAELIDNLNNVKKSPEELNKINREILSTWLVGWLPISSLQANGRPGINRIKLSEDSQQPYTIQDDSWYDPATGRFARVMETDDKIIFANSYDGNFIYQSESMDNGTIKVKSQAVTANFRAPDNPAVFLGLTAGVQQCLDEKCLRRPVQKVTNDFLADGTQVTVYKVGFTDPAGELKSYSLFKVRQSDGIIAELEYIANGKPQITIRRVLSELVEKPEFSWNLTEMSNKELAGETPGAVTVASDGAIQNVSVRDMVEKSSFETYIFATDPPWTQHRTIVDVPDTMSVPKRMFVAIYNTQDNRHVILAQSETHNKYMASVSKQVEANGNQINKTVYENGYKVWADSGPVAWWTDITLRSAGIEPAKDRSGYIVETPSGTFVLIVVNGKLTKEELDGLVNSLIPAREYTVR